MKRLLLLCALALGALAVGCGDEETKCDADCAPGGGGGSDGGTGGLGGSGGLGGTGGVAGGGAGSGGGSAGAGGSGGSGGSGGAVNTSWSEERPVACTEDQARAVVSTNLFSDVFQVNVSPRLEPGFSEKATVIALEENMTSITLRTDSGKHVRIKWPGVIGEYPVDEQVFLEQTRDWTIIRKTNRSFASAMFQRNGPIPGETLDPLPFGGPSLRFAMQCNMQDDANCTMDAVAIVSDAGETFESGTIIRTGSWTISNRSAMQSANCPGYVPLRSLIWAEGGQ